ncbi:methyl coenzyme M reductase beta subunit [Metabacillus crassostreae]|uniref:hypothetical protein n=1 Tax=Metabacillus crassostreae TaxID=929098 RepID=UPI00195B12F5|nr:hypothetical protein [Metabacillus crassostreae]MBM7602359.1 methyl coenzyme M reductase beta subunit [Metabacillus crassostreae]
MRNYRYLLSDKYNAGTIAEDLKVQLDINRFQDVHVKAVDNRNEVLVQVPSTGPLSLEETVDSFMEEYKTGVILE